MRRATQALVLTGLFLVATAAEAQQQYVYPSHGQGPKTQARDEANCSHWATQKTGFDPSNPPVAPVAEAKPVTGSGARLVGAGAGAVVAGVAGGNAGTGALVGAVGGGVTKRIRNKRAANKQNEATASQIASMNHDYLQARASCLSGKGYSVK